ncbi:homocysteine S-methyltransferase [Microbacterium sp. NPDC091313]
MTDDLAAALADRVVVLDGGLGSLLEERGADVSGPLWSARVLHEHPDAVRSAHAEFVAAGAEVVTTASYQLGYGGALDDADVTALLRRSVAVARDSGARWVAASVGPYGALRADGSEYTGAYDLDDAALRTWHRRRLAALAEGGADVLAVETIASPAEAAALAAELDALGAPAFASLSADSTAFAAGGVAAALAELSAARGVLAVGVNCCRADTALAAAASRAPLSAPWVVYPNGGGSWDAQTRTWVGVEGHPHLSEMAPSWVAAGARLVGGCCRTGPDDIAALAAAIGVSDSTRT